MMLPGQNKETKVSVIVPVYNGEKYISKCFDSIAGQTLGDIQVILVNDGSTDESEKVCLEYVEKYPNFEYYHKENGGSASARNVGLDHAVGEYIGFVDSDDWIEPDMYEKMYSAAKDNGDVDIVFNTMRTLENFRSYCFTVPSVGLYDKSRIVREIYPELLPHPNESGTFRSFDWSNCYRLYKRELVFKNGIRYFEKSRRCEDMCFAFECTVKAESYFIMEHENLYHYCVSETSKSRHYTKNMWNSISLLLKNQRSLCDSVEGFDFSNAYQYCVFSFCVIVVKNEVFGAKKNERLAKIKQIISDEKCVESLKYLEGVFLNKEYTDILHSISTGNAYRVYLTAKWWNFKKKKLAPIIAKVRK